jgi:hypothetical protein
MSEDSNKLSLKVKAIYQRRESAELKNCTETAK